MKEGSENIPAPQRGMETLNGFYQKGGEGQQFGPDKERSQDSSQKEETLKQSDVFWGE